MQNNKRLLCHFHLHYTDQIDFFIEKMKNIQEIDWDLIVTTDVEADLEKIKQFKKDAQIIHVENRGYDVWPFIQVIKNINLSKYDFILKLHTKNRNSKGSFEWRNKLVNTVLKNEKTFKCRLKQFEKNKQIGMITSGKWFLLAEGPEAENNEMLEEELVRIGFKTKERHYAAGTMFIARASIFEFLKSDKITKEMFVPATGSHLSGTYAHVYERIISYSAYENGYKIYRTFDGVFVQRFLQRIFAAQNTHDGRHKQITLLGFKIKIRKKPK